MYLEQLVVTLAWLNSGHKPLATTRAANIFVTLDLGLLVLIMTRFIR